jgi:(p)ppGpp synthase/HD superfamily hydrolase
METRMEINGFEETLQQILANEQLAGAEDILRKVSTMLANYWLKAKKPEKSLTSMQIAAIAAGDLHLGIEPILAILLKDLVDQPELSEDSILPGEGKIVSEFISALRKMERLDTTKSMSNAENFIKLLLTLSEDIRVIMIRLAIQLYNMRNINTFSDENQQLIAGETTMIFIPISHRIGFYKIKTEMEDLVMQFRDIETYNHIAGKISALQIQGLFYQANLKTTP